MGGGCGFWGVGCCDWRGLCVWLGVDPGRVEGGRSWGIPVWWISTGLEVRFDDDSLVCDGGLLLAGTIVKRLGVRVLIDTSVVVTGDGGADAGVELLTLVMSGLSGGGVLVSIT